MNFWLVFGIAGSAAIASVLGGLLSLWRKPTTLFMSVALGFASGVLFAAISFEMVPRAAELSSKVVAALGLVTGFAFVYAFDLFVHHGRLAGPLSQQRARTERFYQCHHPRASKATVLAAATSVEEIIEGVSIGVGSAIDPGLGFIIAAAIAIDNVGEGASIGELILNDEHRPRTPWHSIVGWTGAIGMSVFCAALAGWWLLRDMEQSTLGFLLAAGAGGMFYLTATSLLPEAEQRQYQQSAAIASAAGFIAIFLLSG